MNNGDWEKYRAALRIVKDTPARYKVPKSLPEVPLWPFSISPEDVLDSLVQPTTYDLFIWIHHFVAKDNNVSKSVLYVHYNSQVLLS